MSQERSHSTEAEERELETMMSNGNGHDKQLAFALILKQFPILLSKSQIPAVKEKKTIATQQMIHELQSLHGMTFTSTELMKKISRMKGDVKTKCDANATGNRKVELKQWEKVMFDLIRGDQNPAICKLKGGVSVGIKQSISRPNLPPKTGLQSSQSLILLQPSHTQSDEDSGNAALSTTADLRVAQSSTKPPRPLATVNKRTAENVLDQKETEETKLLSTQQLQRLVLLEQLAILKLKRRRLEDPNNGNEVVAEVFVSSDYRLLD